MSSSAILPPSSASNMASAMQSLWGKPLKIAPKDNPLSIPVYKLAARDGRGAWFARRSVHSGLNFDRWSEAIQREFPTSLAVKGAPGEGNVRGIGADERLERIEVEGCGRLDGSCAAVEDGGYANVIQSTGSQHSSQAPQHRATLLNCSSSPTPRLSRVSATKVRDAISSSSPNPARTQRRSLLVASSADRTRAWSSYARSRSRPNRQSLQATSGHSLFTKMANRWRMRRPPRFDQPPPDSALPMHPWNGFTSHGPILVAPSRGLWWSAVRQDRWLRMQRSLWIGRPASTCLLRSPLRRRKRKRRRKWRRLNRRACQLQTARRTHRQVRHRASRVFRRNSTGTQPSHHTRPPPPTAYQEAGRRLRLHLRPSSAPHKPAAMHGSSRRSPARQPL
jgi:hypothetical protein